MQDDEEIGDEEAELNELQNVFDEIFSAPSTQKEKIEFKIMFAYFDKEKFGIELNGIEKLITMKAKKTYKR